MSEPIPFKLSQVAAADYKGPAPQEILIVGSVPGEEGTVTSVNGHDPDGSGNVTLTAADVAAVPTSEVGQPNGVVPLGADSKIAPQYLDVSGVSYKGTWNATTNAPTLADGVGTAGDMYKVSVAGTRDLGSGELVFEVGDHVLYDGAAWDRVPGSDGTTDALTLQGQNGAYYLSRANHTGAQAIATVTGLQAALDAKAAAADLTAHVANTSNPHTVTKTQVGLGSVTNDAQVKAADKATEAQAQAGADDTKWMSALNVAQAIGSLAVPKPPSLIPKVLIGTSLENNTLGLVGYSQDADPDTLAMREFTGQVTTTAPTADTHAANKKYVDDEIAAAGAGGGGTVQTPGIIDGSTVNFGVDHTAPVIEVVDASLSSKSISLTAGLPAGTTFEFIRVDATANTVTVETLGSETIGGGQTGTTATLTAQYKAKRLVKVNATLWVVVSASA